MENKTVLSAVIVVLLTLALVSTASASWTHKGKGELKENASLTLKGTLTLSTSAGNVSCSTELGATLTASSSSGHVNSFTVAKPSECDLTGSLAAVCGTNGLTKVEKTGTWALTADETDITLTGIEVDYVMAGCLIPSFKLKGSSTLSLDKTAAIGSATFSGTQTLYNAAGEESGSGELKGTLAASPAGTYGVKTAATVETKWTDAGEQLSEDGKLTLTGSFSFSGTGGSISCPATVKLLLESSTIEEEEPEGEVESFTVSKAAECDLSGNYKTTCGTNAVTKVEQTGTATLTATEEDFTIAGLVLDYELEKCAITSLKVEGNPTVSVTSPESIASASFSAGSLEVFNSKGETLNTATAGGSASASPGGTYQLVDSKHKEETLAHEEETAHAIATEKELEGHGWTYNGAVIEEGSKVQEEYEGFLSFTTPPPAVPIHSTFGCEVTVVVQVEGTENETGHAEVTQFSPTTGTCVGTGVFTNCKLKADSSNPPWTVDINATDLTVTGTMEINHTYESCPSGITGSKRGFVDTTVTTTNGANGGISTLTIDNFLAENGFSHTNGSLHAETEGRLSVDY
jgi:hypothetical protein